MPTFSNRAALAALLLCASGCKKDEPEAMPAAPRASAPAPSAALPVDRTLPDELPEGSEKAFGLLLPHATKVTARFPGQVFARGPVGIEPVTNYLRRRLVAQPPEMGATRVVFSTARVATSGGGPFLRIELSALADGCEIMMQDLTPPPVASGLSEEERWNKAGLRPDGRVLDPDHAF